MVCILYIHLVWCPVVRDDGSYKEVHASVVGQTYNRRLPSYNHMAGNGMIGQ